MGRTFARLLLATALTSYTTIAAAQDTSETETTDQVLPEVRAEGDRAEASYTMGSGNEAGTTRMTEAEIRARAPGSGDANQLLKALPTVQFTRDEGLATREDIQDIRPADISISGGRYYENLITIDGIDANSRLDITQDKPSHYAEPAGASAQSLWVDTNLVGAITLRDANVSAEYGRFTGGALDIETRSPKRTWGGSATLSYTSDALTNFKISNGSRAAIDEDEMPGKPSFEKWRYGASLDAPISQDVGLLLAYNRSRSQVVYTRAETYGGNTYTQASTSDNFLAKLEADLTADLRLTGQVSYTPYESEYANANGIDNELVTKGGGLTSQFKLAHSGETTWSIAASLSHSDTSRDAQENNYSIPSFSANGNVCSRSSCTIGGFGDVDQWQDNYALTGRWSAPVGPGRLSAGFDYQRIEAMRSRPEDTYAYSRGTDEEDAASIVCAEADSLTCVTGEYALEQYSVYSAYRAKVGLDSVAAWTQYEVELGDLALRGGLRYDWESFLGNHTVSPRLSASYALPWTGWSVTLGANRYYGRSMLAYALREQYPDNLTYSRTGTASGDSLVYSDADWTLYRTSHSTSYSDGNKKTPYSDELSAAVSGRILGGALRVKGIYRKGRNEFTRSEGETETTELIDGTLDDYTNYVITNEGHSTYRGVSFEYTRSFGKHSFAFNTNFSKTKTSNDDYLTTLDEDTDFVVFEGEVLTLAQLQARNQREDMAAPFIANLTWTALWLDDRITTNVNLRYRGSFEQIEDTGESETVDGTSYDLYDYVHYPAALDVNLNAQAELVRSRLGVLTGDVRVANLLDRTPSPNSTATSQPFQYGRSFWLGLNYRF